MITKDRSPVEETDADRLRNVISDDALSLDIVGAYAGDRALSTTEDRRLTELKTLRGNRFYSDLLYSITHQHFSPIEAQQLWEGILQHKFVLSKALGRNVKVAVATLDYLSNIKGQIFSTTLVGEEHIGEIIGASLIDGLTGLYNHAYFYQQIELEVKRFLRYNAPVSLALIDIDDFKMVNDAFGHREGDRILSAMGQTLRYIARESDICCRYGGEEFAVILPHTALKEAKIIAERMRKKLIKNLADGTPVTVSIGVATCKANCQTYKTLVEHADESLYRAKKSGKNQVIAAN